MAINFPTSLDTITNPTSGDGLDSPSHAGQHTDANDILEALEAKVGVDSSAVASSHDYKIKALEDGRLNLDQTTPQTITAGQPIQDILTASELVATDASKKLSSLPVATYPSLAELAYGKGVTSGIQGQFTNKLGLAGGTMTGDILGAVSYGATGTRVTKVWAEDIEITNAPTVGGVVVPTISSTNTLTNKRITKRVATATDDATAVIDCDSYDEYYLTAVANNTTFSITGTPTAGQTIFIGWKDAGTAKTLTFTSITGLGITLPETTTVSKQGIAGLKYINSAWRMIALSTEA